MDEVTKQVLHEKFKTLKNLTISNQGFKTDGMT